MAIDTREALQEHLQWAIQVELSTIPTYLYSMYSIENEHAAPFNLIRSIVVEEMLHASLVANVLVAVGGQPRFYDEEVIPAYPKPLPHHTPEIILNLEECSPEVVECVFAEIEKPKTVEGVPQDDNYETIEQFYLAIEQALERLDEEQTLFDPDSTGQQMSDPRYYSPVEYDAEDSGGLFPVVDCDSAERAIEIIIDQGEGYRTDHKYADPNHEEFTHYYKFKQIADGTYPLGDTRPVLKNPQTTDFSESLKPVSELFNASYCYLFALLEEIYSQHDKETENRLVWNLYPIMTQVLRPLARFLTKRPAHDETTRHAGPTFEVYRFQTDTTPRQQLLDLCDPVTDEHQEFSRLPEILSQLEDLPSW